MTKNIVGVVAGVAVWIAVVSVAGLILRLMWPAYAEVVERARLTTIAPTEICLRRSKSEAPRRDK